MMYHWIYDITVGIALAGIFFLLWRIWTIISEKLLNEVKPKLTRAMYAELRTMTDDTLEHKAMWRYFRQQLHDVYDSYKYVKQNGVSTLKSEAFERDLLGDTYTEILNQYPFPTEFAEAIVRINKKNWLKFKSDCLYDISTCRRKSEHITLLQANVIDAFARNVGEIYEVFLSMLTKQKYITVHQQQTTTGIVEINESVKINRDSIKAKVQTSKEGLAEVIELLLFYTRGTEHHNTVNIIAGRYSDYMKCEIEDTPRSDTEMNAIRHSLLYLIDKL